MKIRLFLSAFIAFFLANMSIAQSPGSFNYQGIVRGAGGNPYTDQEVAIRFTVLDQSLVSVYSETDVNTTNTFGYINTQIGDGNPSTFSLIDWGGGSFSLKVELDLGNDGSFETNETSPISSVPIALYGEDADSDPQNEIQALSLANRSLSISGSNSINLPNDIQSLSLTNNSLELSGSNSVNLTGYLSPWTNSNNDLFYSAGSVAVGNSAVSDSKLHVQGDAGWSDDNPLFQVKNEDGVPVFAVYNNGVRILVEDDPLAKGRTRGGFSVGGFDRNVKGYSETYDFMRISPDSVRFNINNTAVAKGSRGGFAVGGFDRNVKGPINEDFMHLTPKSADQGLYNTFIGYKAGEANTATGNFNSFIGYESGLSNTTGDYNTFMGYQSGSTNTNGNNNIYLGNLAGTLNNASFNTFIGKSAGEDATTADWSTLIGFAAGASITTSDYNTMVGSWSGAFTTTGTRNVYLGTYSAWLNMTGSSNVIIGYSAGEQVTGSGNVIIGTSVAKSAGAISNKLYIDNTSTLTPLINGDFFERWLQINGRAYIAGGQLNGYGLRITTGLNDYRAHGIRIECGSNSTISSTTYALSVADGNGTWAGSITLRNGSLQFNQTSDRRLKTNIQSTGIDALSVVEQLPVVDFAYLENPDVQLTGFIAQDVEKVLPNAVSSNENGMLQLSQMDIIPVLTKAIQEQSELISKQESDIEILRTEVDQLKQMLNLVLEQQK